MLKKIWERHRKRISEGGSELLTFKTKRLRNHGKSDLTWKFYKLENVASYQFAHALPKGTYPEFRNNPNNIVFVDSIEQHERVDRATAWKKFLVTHLVMHGELIPRLKGQWDFYYKQKHGIQAHTARENTQQEKQQDLDMKETDKL